MNAVTIAPLFAVLAVLAVLAVVAVDRRNARADDRSYLSSRLARNAEDRSANRRAGYYAVLARTAGSSPMVYTYLRRPPLAGDADRYRAAPWRRLRVAGVEDGDDALTRFPAM